MEDRYHGGSGQISRLMMTIQELEKQLGRKLADILALQPETFSVDLKMEYDVGLVTAFARELVKVLASQGDSFLIVKATGIWPSAENLYIVEVFRKHLGEHRSLFEAPAHFFAKGDFPNAQAMLQLSFINLWDFQYALADGNAVITGSHDEVITIDSKTKENFDRLEAIARQFGLRKQAKGREQAPDPWAKTRELNGLLRENRAGLQALSQLTSLLLENIPGENQERFISELQQLFLRYPSETFVRESLAQGISRAIFFASEEQDWEAADRLIASLRNLSGSYPNDRALIELLGRSLYHAAALNAKHGRNSIAQTLIQNLKDVANMYPDLQGLRQWIEAIPSIANR